MADAESRGGLGIAMAAAATSVVGSRHQSEASVATTANDLINRSYETESRRLP